MPPAPTKLTQLQWDVPGVGVVVVRAAAYNDCAAIDKAWPAGRRPSDVHHVWRWVDISSTLKECFVVVKDGHPVAIWGSTVSRPLKLGGMTFYRLDYLEIDPAHRGEVLGVFLVSVIASRALELGASGIVLTAFSVPGLVEFYEGTGAIRGSPRGWNHPKELVALTFELAALHRLKDLADALLEEKQA